LIETSKDMSPSIFAKKIESEIEVMTHWMRNYALIDGLKWREGIV